MTWLCCGGGGGRKSSHHEDNTMPPEKSNGSVKPSIPHSRDLVVVPPPPPPRPDPPSEAPSKQQQQQQQDPRQKQQLGTSLQSAWEELVAENPRAAEEHEFQRAIELSLLECALVTTNNSSSANNSNIPSISPHKVLGLSTKHPPTVDEIKAAFRQKALETHPDKGGQPGEFERVAVAYRTLLTQTQQQQRRSHPSDSPPSPQQKHHKEHEHSASAAAAATLKSTAHWDQELKNHKDLVAELFASHGDDLTRRQDSQWAVRQTLGLVHYEAGSSNVNEKRERIRNSCFYLSLAVSYLCGIGALMTIGTTNTNNNNNNNNQKNEEYVASDQALIAQTALQLKRTIERAVLQAHPEWARNGMVGEEVQAFSDFLVYTLQSSSSILTDWAVAIFDETSGFCDIYKGCHYEDDQDDDDNGKNQKNDWMQRANTLTLRFVPGHYQPLLPTNPNRRPCLKEIITALDAQSVFYVVTDGNSAETTS